MFPSFPEYHESRLIVVAARPMMGRTRFLCALANERANWHPVLIYSLEYSENQIQKQLYESGYCLTDYDYEIIIDDTPSLSLQEIQRRLQSMVALHKIKTVVIDYINLICDVDFDSVLRSLKSLAMELRIELIVGVFIDRRRDNPNDLSVSLTDLKLGATEAIDEFIPLQSQNQYCF